MIRDQLVYGANMGLNCLMVFLLIVYAGSGQGWHALPVGCNEGSKDGCETIFKARAATFSTFSFLLLVKSWEVKHFHRSLFAMDDRWTGPLAVFPTIYHNRFLFWSVVAGFLSTFPLIYIPVLNTQVFRHIGLTWEWGVVFGSVALFVALIEVWKAIKRRFRLGLDKTPHEVGAA